MTPTLFETPKPVIAALHLPDFALNRHLPVSWYEDYAVTNARVFAEAGIPWIKLQDQTRTTGTAAPETLARMAALGRLIRREVPGPGFGIIVEAHDATAALAVAHAAGAGFVRLKVFVGGAMTALCPRSGLNAQAVAQRATPRRPDIAILADVHDRTAIPLSGECQPVAAQWAVKAGADALILTGSRFADTRARIQAVRATGLDRPILIGGGVDAGNVADAMECADGVIVAAFGDPGLMTLRARLQVPVTGIAQAGMAEAAEGGRRFAVVTTTPDLRVEIAATAARHDHAGFLGTWCTRGDTRILTACAEALETALLAACQEAAAQGAEAIVIGGGPLAEAARRLAPESPVPLIEPVRAAVRLGLARRAEAVGAVP